ncbi:carboxylesterase [Parvularcula bermudensis HTCC2503]|uniref:Carboxylic ester hydrolase n=1 Tax=Parvularcula bermudensis (strain ATCC BAA-594 / HTCC2503 / KCTC 12087) TaxID=314260 RepID=E0TFM6_PARBH|nr:carboxylesterase family protein [Parvularcula bermudensis]ADM10586.1 carboxylesterase [Parvularcula bermudensis HTCC2503]
MGVRNWGAGALLALMGLIGAGCDTLPGRVPHLVTAKSAEPILVTIKDGRLRGLKTPDSIAFLGIPYAAPPVGDARFRPPQPPPPWEGVRDATAIGPACFSNMPSPGPTSEDCLNLNVYAPNGAVAGTSLPVMVWIHGGGLLRGTASQYDPSDLAREQNVVVVAPNYRLGALGFLAHPALRGPGEGAYGLLDQQAALAWVQENIAAFGGDPGRVTLFGESAGALSVCSHVAVPESRALFDAAIIQSGSCTHPDTTVPQADAEAGGLQMAADLGCGAPATAADCLRALSPGRLVRAQSWRRGHVGQDAYAPMTGGDVLPAPPEVLFAEQKPDLPILMGNNLNEGRLFSNILSYSWALKTRGGYERRVRRMMPSQFGDQVLAAYEDLAERSYAEAYAAILTDSHFACPVLTLHRLIGAQAAFYAYEFNDPNAPSRIPRAPFAPPIGSYHAAEIAYVFQRPWALASPASFTDEQWALADRMQAHWGRFAYTGAPGTEWPAFDGGDPQWLSPEVTGDAQQFALRHRCDFWHALGY